MAEKDRVLTAFIMALDVLVQEVKSAPSTDQNLASTNESSTANKPLNDQTNSKVESSGEMAATPEPSSSATPSNLGYFLKTLRSVFEYKMRLRTRGFNIFAGQSSGVWDFIYETISKRRDAQSQNVLSSVIDSTLNGLNSPDLDIQFFKYCMLQQSLAHWVEIIVSDQISVKSFYEPTAIIRSDSNIIVEELKKVSACEFDFVFKAEPSSSLFPVSLASLSTISNITTTATNNATALASLGFHSLSVAKDGIGSLGKAASAKTVALLNATRTASGGGDAATQTAVSADVTSNNSGVSEEVDALKSQLTETLSLLEAEKKERLSLQVQLVSVQHARDIEISNLQSQLLRQTRMIEQLNEKHKVRAKYDDFTTSRKSKLNVTIVEGNRHFTNAVGYSTEFKVMTRRGEFHPYKHIMTINSNHRIGLRSW
jgi:hypothetical protein